MQRTFLLIIVIIGFLFTFTPHAKAASVSLSWIAPTQNCDLSALTDLGGYVVIWGPNQGGPYPYSHNVDDPLAISTTIDVGDVENVTLYFVSVSVDASGNRSDDPAGCGTSNEVAIPFGPIPPAPPTGMTGAAVP